MDALQWLTVWDFKQVLVRASLHSMHPWHQEHIRVLLCVLCDFLKYWNLTLLVIDDVEREHKDTRLLKNAYWESANMYYPATMLTAQFSDVTIFSQWHFNTLSTDLLLCILTAENDNRVRALWVLLFAVSPDLRHKQQLSATLDKRSYPLCENTRQSRHGMWTLRL